MVTRFNRPGAWPQKGGSFSHGVVQPQGRVVHVTGQVAWDQDGNVVGEGDCELQTRKCFDSIELILATVGGRLDDIVSLTIYFLNRADLPVIQKVRSERIAPEIAPTSTIVQTPGLVVPELLVEVVPIAVIPDERYHDPVWRDS